MTEVNDAIALFPPALARYRWDYQEKLRLYCSDKHPLFDKDKASLQQLDLEAYRFVTTRYLSSFGHRVPAHGEALAQNMAAVTVLLLSGHYLGYLPEHMAHRFVKKGLLKVLDLEEYTLGLQFAVLTRNESQTVIQKAFLEELFQFEGNKE